MVLRELTAHMVLRELTAHMVVRVYTVQVARRRRHPPMATAKVKHLKSPTSKALQVPTEKARIRTVAAPLVPPLGTIRMLRRATKAERCTLDPSHFTLQY